MFTLSVLSALFLLTVVWRVVSNGFRFDTASLTWLLVGLIFGAVSGWQWWLGTAR